jgi:hypothetical protein
MTVIPILAGWDKSSSSPVSRSLIAIFDACLPTVTARYGRHCRPLFPSIARSR